MLTKKIQITEKTTISLARCNEETLSVDVIRFYFKEELVGIYIASAMEKKATVCLYELVERARVILPTSRQKGQFYVLFIKRASSTYFPSKGLVLFSFRRNG